MSVELTEWQGRQAVTLFSEPVPGYSGAAWTAGGFGDDEHPHETGGNPPRGPLSWGASGEAPADAEWLLVSDLGGLTGYLWAAYAEGKLYLHLGETAPAGSGEQGADDGSGYIGECGEDELAYGVGRGVSPALYILPMDERENLLKTADGAWRADLAWDVLLCCNYSQEKEVPKSGYTYRLLTVWVITSGNMLAFYATDVAVGTRYDPNWAAFGSIMRCYNDDPHNQRAENEQGVGRVLPFLTGVISELYPLWVAPLPWQDRAWTAADGERAVFDGDPGTEQVNLGTLNAAMADDNGAFTVGQGSMVPDAGVFFCPRLHIITSRWGDWLPPGETDFFPFRVNALNLILYGQPDGFEQNHGLYAMPEAPGYRAGCPVVPGFNMLFDPWAVEGMGLYSRNNYNFARVDCQDYLPPVATDWQRVAAATLQGPGGPVWVEIAGASTDGCMLTASASTENF